MKKDEEEWFGYQEMALDDDDETEHEDTSTDADSNKPLPILLFLRTTTASSLLKSRSAVDLVARESVRPDSIHLICLGRGIDASTDDLSEIPGRNVVGAAIGRLQPKSIEQLPQLPQNFNHPFAGMSQTPPGSGLNQMGSGPGGFNEQNANASGINDPPGSKRFNIFLARTVDPEGNPGIMGAIAPPQAGNIFPQMLSMIAQQQQQQQQQQQNDDAQGGYNAQNMQKWTDLMQSQMQNLIGNAENGDGAVPFNTTLSGLPNANQPPDTAISPEIVQKAIQDAMYGVLERLAQINESDTPLPPGAGGKLPPHLAKAFGQILRNPALRQSIAQSKCLRILFFSISRPIYIISQYFFATIIFSTIL